MALALTDGQFTAENTGINATSITAGSTQVGSSISRTADADIGIVTVLLDAVFAADPADGSYLEVWLAPVEGGTDYDDVVGPGVVPVDAAATYNYPVQIQWPPGCQTVKLCVANQADQTVEATAIINYQEVTV